MTEIVWQHYPLVANHPAARAFIESLAKRQHAPKTIDAYARNLEDLLGTWPDSPPERIGEADASDIDTYLERLATRSRLGPKPETSSKDDHRLSDATIRQRLVTARLFFDFCLQRQLRKSPFNPVPRGSRHSQPPRRGLVPQRRRLPWIPNDLQWQRVLTDLFEHEPLRNQVLVLLAYDAALRRQELLALRLDDVDWSLGLVQVRAESAKSGQARKVPISPSTELLLRRYVQTVRSHLILGFGGLPAGPLFLSESQRNPGAPLRPGAFNDIVERLRTRLDLPELHPHTFRHLRLTVLKRCGVTLDDIALFAGHLSLSSTQLYLHLAPTELARRIRDATSAFDRRLAQLIEERVDGSRHEASEPGAH
ncbi:MAG: tyrosine-type recombinase/integrase [Nitrososphaerota archaeon]|nr:tyrosine-type recombinase/integrase [Nitrososphaerota archaeon]